MLWRKILSLFQFKLRQFLSANTVSFLDDIEKFQIWILLSEYYE